ncbi:MAG: hypothetical protein HY909_24015 [Deltaproteobacteria bacterium]|nr:hypothetical protein [Deltaproteobacteria bacterium]
MRRGRRYTLALALVLVGAGASWRWGSPGAGAAPPEPLPLSVEPSQTTTRQAITPREGARPSGPVDPPEAAPEAREPQAAAPQGGEDPGPGPWFERSGGRTGRLSPFARPEGSVAVTVERSYGGAPVLECWVEDTVVPAGAAARLHARVRASSGTVRVGRVTVTTSTRPGVTTETVMNADGDGYSAQFDTREVPVTAGQGAPPRVDYVVRAEGLHDGVAFTREALGSFRVHAPGGAVDPATARMGEAPEGVTVTLRATVTVAGTYGLYGELWGGEGGRVPVAFARERFPRLEPGARDVTLTFGQGVLRDAHVQGPWVLRNVRWRHASAVPPHEQRVPLERTL